VIVSGLRHAIIASPGRRLGVGDFAGIEARVALAGAGQHDKTEMMASGQDVYIDMANAIYKRTDITKDNLAERQTGKNSVLGLGFQMGAPKFRTRYCPEQTVEFAEGVVKTYRKEWAPKVPYLWYGLQDASTKAVWQGGVHEAYGCAFQMEDGWLTMLLPSNRKLWYWNPQPVRKSMPWDPTDVRPAWTYQAMKQGHLTTISAFGGQLTENYASGLARDLLVSAMKRCKANDIDIVLTVHDEIISELKPHQPLSLLQQCMEERDQWAIDIGIPVAAECWEGPRYHK
jgi:DNA polymerase